MPSPDLSAFRLDEELSCVPSLSSPDRISSGAEDLAVMVPLETFALVKRTSEDGAESRVDECNGGEEGDSVVVGFDLPL